jgi:hypothetical protein
MNSLPSLDFPELKNIISQCNLEEKLELLELLEKDTFATRFNKFLNSVKTDELTLEDITREVEIVRQVSYHEQ